MKRFLDFFVGPSDDLTPAEYLAAAGTLPPDQARAQILTTIKQAGRLPRILSAMVDKQQLEPDRTLAEVVAGFRLVAQRYTPEAEALQELVYDRVTTYRGKQIPFTLSIIAGKKVRGFPSALDVMASLGSQTASLVLTARGDTAYDGYSTQLAAITARVREHVAHPTALAGMHLQLTQKLLSPETHEWLNAALGMWIHTRHTLLLYTKQSYTTLSNRIRRLKVARVSRQSARWRRSSRRWRSMTPCVLLSYSLPLSWSLPAPKGRSRRLQRSSSSSGIWLRNSRRAACSRISRTLHMSTR